MKRIIILFFILSTIVFFSINYVPNINDKIQIYVSEFSVIELTQDYIDNRSTLGYELSDKVIKDMPNNIDDYKVICAYYQFKNTSQDITMEDVRFHPKFEKKLTGKIVSYNDFNGTYYKYVEPGLSNGMRQYIIIKEPEKTIEEIYNDVIGQNISLEYTPGTYRDNIGFGRSGLRNSINFKLEMR